MNKRTTNGISILLNIILILFLAVYFLVAFLNYPALVKVFSPLCGLIDKYQGEKYKPAWCNEIAKQTPINANQNINAINKNTNVQIANPASEKCLKDGGKLETYDSLIGQFSLCVFSDQSICDEWDYFRGDCQKGKCFKSCLNTGTGIEGWYNSCSKGLIKLEKCSTPVQPQTEQNIKVTNPIANQQLISPFKVEGSAQVAGNQVYIRVKSKDGKVLINESAVVKSPEIGQWGDFSLEISYDFSLTKEGFVEVYSTNLKDGSEENLVSVPVKF